MSRNKANTPFRVAPRLSRTVAALAAAVIALSAGTAQARPTQAQQKDIMQALRNPAGRRAPGVPAMGYKPSSQEQFARNARFRLTRGKRDARPASLILTEYLPPIGNQGNQSSCVGWASAYYTYSYAVGKQMKLSNENTALPRFQFSPAFVYNLGNDGEDEGMTIAGAFEILHDKGCATLQEMPYSDKNHTTQPDKTANARADRYKAPVIGCLYKGDGENDKADVEALKTFLAETRQPFAMGIPIFKDFPGGGDYPGGPNAARDFVYNLSIEPLKSNFRGGHAITIVGYDDSKKAFRMVNSWGRDWMDNGFMWIGEQFIEDWGMDIWSCVPGGPSTRAADKLPARITPHAVIEPPLRSAER